MLKLPGLIDPHVHLRDPGQTFKEDFTTGTSSALAGGFTAILDMPNNLHPVTSNKLLSEKMRIAKRKILCDVGFHFGSLGENPAEFYKVQDKVFGLKVYLNQTTGNFIVNEGVFYNICLKWPPKKPILVHAEEDILEQVLSIGKQTGQHIHVCHVSSKSELKMIMKAKKSYKRITCGVTPHHLYLTERDVKNLGPYGKVKPYLKSRKDVDFLWKNLKHIDIIESDHAPHTKEEKAGDNPPFGIAGLETTLSLLLNSHYHNKISLDEIIRLCHDNPAKIFKVKTYLRTKIIVDENEGWIVDSDEFFTKCKTSPFNGMRLTGRVKTVFIRGKKVFENGKILAKPGSGKILTSVV